MLEAKRKIATIAILLSVTTIQAQTIDPIEALSATLARIDTLIEDSTTTHLLDNATLQEEVTVDISDVEALREAQKQSHASLSGLELRAGYELKYGEGTEDIYDDFYSYRNRFNVMLSWNILNSGLIGKRSVEQRADLEAEQLTLQLYSAQSKEMIFSQSQKQEEVLDGYINKVYATQKELYTSLQALLDILSEQGQSTAIQRAEMQLQAQMVSSLMRTTPAEVQRLLDIKEYLERQVVIDLGHVESLLEESSTIQRSKIDEQLIGNKAEETTYWQGVTVSPYVKVQQYSDAYFTASRVTTHLGVNATLPLFSGTKSRRTELHAQSKIAQNSTSMIESSLRVNIGEVAMQLNYNLEQLRASALLEQLCREQIKVAQKAYSHKQLSMQDMAQYYIKLLSLHAQIIEQIDQREALKTKLMLTAI